MHELPAKYLFYTSRLYGDHAPYYSAGLSEGIALCRNHPKHAEELWNSFSDNIKESSASVARDMDQILFKGESNVCS